MRHSWTDFRALWERQYRYELVLWSLGLSRRVSTLSRHRWAWSAHVWSYLLPEDPRIPYVMSVVVRRERG